MFEGVSISMQPQGGKTNDFPITIGLDQGSVICLYLFTLILDVFTKHIQELATRCMFFVDDIVLLEESMEGLNERLETRFRKTWILPKMKYMEYKFNKRRCY